MENDLTPTRTPILTAALLTVLAPAAWAESSVIPTSGDGFSVYAEVEGWTIYADSATKTCLAERTDDVGNAIQMGPTKDREFAYIGVFTKGELPKRDGKEIAVAIDGNIFTGEVKRLSSKKLAAGYNGGYLLTNNPNFVTAVAEGKELLAFPDSPVAFKVDLTGTKAAIESARKCNAEIAG